MKRQLRGFLFLLLTVVRTLGGSPAHGVRRLKVALTSSPYENGLDVATPC